MPRRSCARRKRSREPTGDVAPAGPTGRRYGILGMLLIIAATVTLGFQLFIADSEQTSKRAATANPIQTSAAPAPLPERAAEPRPPAGVRRNPTAYATAGAAAQVKPASKAHQPPSTINQQKSNRHRSVLIELCARAGICRAQRAVPLHRHIEPGVNVNVVNARDGWLEIHSKHARPLGIYSP